MRKRTGYFIVCLIGWSAASASKGSETHRVLVSGMRSSLVVHAVRLNIERLHCAKVSGCMCEMKQKLSKSTIAVERS